ncbi:ABC transporter ATP-binding protein [Brooklawnia cerclae]
MRSKSSPTGRAARRVRETLAAGTAGGIREPASTDRWTPDPTGLPLVSRGGVHKHGSMNSTDVIAEVNGLGKTYGSFAALTDVTFDIRRGEVLSLLGPNGAGKSTTIEILEGYRNRTSGTVRVLGQDPATAGRAWRARLGIVLQSSGMPEEMTVRELVRHFAAFYPAPRDADQTIAAVGLTEKARSRVSTLSGGQKRRVDVALGIIGRPDLLFLDEPTTGFDPAARREFWTLIEGLRDEGTTVLLTTHYLDEAAHLSDRAVVIAGGRIVAEGAIDALGGAQARMPVVHWRDAAGDHEVRTPEPAAFVSRLHAEQGEAANLQVIRPSLEDIYLGIVQAGRERPEPHGDRAPALASAH